MALIELIVHASHPLTLSGCVNFCGVTAALGPPYPAGALSSASWRGQARRQGCDLWPPETQLEWTEETDYTAG